MLSNITYITSIIIFTSGLYITQVSDSYLRKMIGLCILQTGVLIFYIALSKVKEGINPILECLDYEKCPSIFTNPLPHVLMLTAIVVGLATLSVGLSLVYRIFENFGTHSEIEVTQNSIYNDE